MDIRIDLYKSWQWDYKLLKLVPAGSYLPLTHRHTTTNYKHKITDNMPDMGHCVQANMTIEWTTKASFSIPRRHTVWDKKKKRKDRTSQAYDIDIFQIAKMSTNHRNLQEIHWKLVIISYHRPSDLTTKLATVYTAYINFSKSWLTELIIPWN